LRFREDKIANRSIPKEMLEAMGISNIKSSSPNISKYNTLLKGGENIERRAI
jgi:hypothetical protein